MGKERSPADRRSRPRSESEGATPHSRDGLRTEEPDEAGDEAADDPRRTAAIPDLIRRAMAMGFSSFFTTEEAIRRALGDTLPQDWVDFASDQSERTRAEFADRMATEFGRVLEQVDLAAVLEQLLQGRTLEVNASVRLVSESEDATRGPVRVKWAVADRGEEDR